MNEAIFLSCGVPDPRRAATADAVAISSALSALAHVALGRRLIVMADDPALTPQMEAAAESLGVEFARWVHLFRTLRTVDEPTGKAALAANGASAGVEAVGSRTSTRERSLSGHGFKAGVFIGGAADMLDDFEVFRCLHPAADVVPLLSTGGASLEIAAMSGVSGGELAEDSDYVALFHRRLDISVREDRFADPALQPDETEQRLWRPAGPRRGT